MAVTFAKRELIIANPYDAFLGYVKQTLPETNSSTFDGGAPLVWASGRLSEATSALNPANQQVAAFATKNAQNGTSKDTEVIMATPYTVFEANVLEAAAANTTLEADDLGANHGLAKASNLAGTGRDGWYIVQDSGTAACKIIDFRSTTVPPNQSVTKAATGDTNARVRAVLLEAAIDW